MAVALFFFSCEDESSLLGFKPKQKFYVGFVDIPLGVSRVMKIDSLITDLRPFVNANGQTQTVDGILVGDYQDADFGAITAQSFLGVYPTSNAALPSTAVFDSITVNFRLNFYAYGFSGEKTHRIAVHEITGDTLTLFGGNRYYANSPAPQYSTDALGEAVITVHYDSLQKEAVADSREQDTLMAVGRLSDAYGQRIFDVVKSGFGTSAEHRLFKAQVKGLALLPGTEPGVLGMNIINNFGQLSNVTLHYHTLTDEGAVADTLIRTLGFEFASFTRIEADRAGTELDALQPYQSVEPLSAQRYIQSGAPVISKLDLSAFYEFADTIDNILINEAELVIESVVAPMGAEPHGSLMFRLMNNNSDQFLNNRVAADRELASEYFVLSGTNEHHYFVADEGSVPATISYNDDENRFSGFMTLFAQTLFKNKNDDDGINENRVRYMALFPANASAARSVTRTLFHKDNVKLRVTYTRANTVTP